MLYSLCRAFFNLLRVLALSHIIMQCGVPRFITFCSSLTLRYRTVQAHFVKCGESGLFVEYLLW